MNGRIAAMGNGGNFAPTSEAMGRALREGYRSFVWLEDIAWNGPIDLGVFEGSFLSIFGYAGPMMTNAHRLYPEPMPMLYSTRSDLWRLHWTGVSFIEDDPRYPNVAPFVRFPKVDRSRLIGVGFYGSSGLAFEFGGEADAGHFSETHISGCEVHHNASGGFINGMRNCTIDGRTSIERNKMPLKIIGDPDASGDSVIRDINLEGDDGSAQLEIYRLTNSKIEDIRLVESALVGGVLCDGTSVRDLKLHGAASVDWPGASLWDRRTWKKIPRNARGV